MPNNIKPSGYLSYSKHTILGIHNKVEKINSKFPKVKDEIEIIMIDLFIKSINNNSNVIFNCEKYVQNNEQDLDFTIHFNDHKSLLELTELVPNGIGKSGGYAKPPNWIDMNELSSRLIDLIMRKS